jgi:hypothetical protein
LFLIIVGQIQQQCTLRTPKGQLQRDEMLKVVLH